MGKIFPHLPFIKIYSNREVRFDFRQHSYHFSLSHGLFSSAKIDSGSRFLLKIFSNFLDNNLAGLKTSAFFSGAPFTLLDAGSGIGVLGICAAGALSDFLAKESSGSINCRAQDRDELARIFSEYNAAKNGISLENYKAYTEPLLSGPLGWNLILSNIPAKAGLPVLEDFIHRSARLLKKDGLVFLVVVNTLKAFFRERITKEAALYFEETGKEHTVFVYGRREGADIKNAGLVFNENFLRNYSFYIRTSNDYELEDISFRLDTIHGAPDFDSPGSQIITAAKLAHKINLAEKLKAAPVPTADKNLLIHDTGQGHFALWLANYLAEKKLHFVLSGRNILALAASRHNLMAVSSGVPAENPTIQVQRQVPEIIPCADIYLDPERLTESGKRIFHFIAYFPEIVPGTDCHKSAWEGLVKLAESGAIVIAAMNSTDAEHFDKKKHPAFTRMGDVKQKGVRAMAYLKN